MNIWIDEALVMAVHQRQLVVHGGASGLRDVGLLQSALARPQQIAADSEGAELADLAAAYTFGIVKNHPFIDGNKRTGFVVGVLFLELNGLRFTASEEEATHQVLALAASEIGEHDYALFLLRNCVSE